MICEPHLVRKVIGPAWRFEQIICTGNRLMRGQVKRRPAAPLIVEQFEHVIPGRCDSMACGAMELAENLHCGGFACAGPDGCGIARRVLDDGEGKSQRPCDGSNRCPERSCRKAPEIFLIERVE